MNRNHRLIAQNSIWLFLGRVFAAGLNLALTVILARVWGEAAYGEYAFIVSLIYLGNVTTTFVLDTLIIRAVASRVPELTE